MNTNNEKKQFNIIISLGGSCCTAHNIRYRNLRYCSMPFDWLFIKNETPISKLIDCFNNNFKEFMQQKNLVELVGDERGTDCAGHYQYKDLFTEYRTIHDFKKPANDNKEFNRVKKIYDRRIKKMYNYLNKSQSVMFVIDSNCPISITILQELRETIKTKFHIEYVEIHSLQFESHTDEEICSEGVYIQKITRKRNSYDIEKTNYEWKFLDNIILKTLTSINICIRNFPLLVIDKIKKGYSFHFFPKINTLFRVYFYFLGFRLDLCFGKVRL